MSPSGHLFAGKRRLKGFYGLIEPIALVSFRYERPWLKTCLKVSPALKAEDTRERKQCWQHGVQRWVTRSGALSSNFPVEALACFILRFVLLSPPGPKGCRSNRAPPLTEFVFLSRDSQAPDPDWRDQPSGSWLPASFQTDKKFENRVGPVSIDSTFSPMAC